MNSSPTSSADSFYDYILLSSINALKNNECFDNFDAQRFNYDGIDRSLEFNAAKLAFYFRWLGENYAQLFDAYQCLHDQRSKELFIALIIFRLVGHLRYKIPVLFRDKLDELRDFRLLECNSARPSEIKTVGMFGPLHHFDFIFNDKRYIVDEIGALEYYLVRGQYFFRRNGYSVAPESGEFVIDGGACLGDTACAFSNAVGVNGRVFAFDPVKNHIDTLRYNIDQFALKNVICMPFGLSDRHIEADLVELNQYSPGFSTIDKFVPLRRLDDLVISGDIPKVDFIKLDIEGSELQALLGARQSIEKYRPKLAISVYHKPNDLFEIIHFIRSNFPFYELFIEHYTIHLEETVLYAALSHPLISLK